MCVVNTYRATNIYTGEAVEGGAKEVAEILGVSDTSIRKACKCGTEVKKAWTVEIIDTSRSGSANEYATPMELWNEWDFITAPFKELSRKVREKHAGICK